MQLKLDLISIIVKDMPTALAFYRQLGLEIPAELDSEGHAEITLDNSLRVGWDTHEIMQQFDEHWQPASEPCHKVGIAFLCESAADVDATFERLVNNGAAVHKPPFDAFWGQRYAQIKDPDGNVLDLFADLG